MAQRVTLFLKPDIVKKARAQAIEEETTLSKLVEKALDKYLPQVVTIKVIKKEDRKR